MIRVEYVSIVFGLVLACGPVSGTPTSTDTDTSGGSTLDTSEVPTSGATSTATTGAASACSGVALPQGLPSGMLEVYWSPLGDDQVNVTFLAGAGRCSEDAPPLCSLEDPVGYTVLLHGEHASPGVHAVSSEPAGDAWTAIALLYAEMIDGACEPGLWMPFADGEVEVLANDGQCVAVDVRGVTPYEKDGVVYDPNGSGRALLCDG